MFSYTIFATTRKTVAMEGLNEKDKETSKLLVRQTIITKTSVYKLNAASSRDAVDLF